jgi:hypothetical protein
MTEFWAATKTHSAIRSTAEKYLSRAKTTEAVTTIRENPLAAIALTAAALHGRKAAWGNRDHFCRRVGMEQVRILAVQDRSVPSPLQ